MSSLSREMSVIQVIALLGEPRRLPRRTEFKENAIAIDPAGCGCRECLVGSSFPENVVSHEMLLEAIVYQRPIIDRRN
jgi:hypothetical protein